MPSKNVNSFLTVNSLSLSTASILTIVGGELKRFTGQTIVIDSSGNVGVGTASPISNLDITGPQPTLTIKNNDYVANAVGTVITIFPETASGDCAARLQVKNTGGSTFGNLLLNPGGGNVGIGTASPATQLQINSGATTYSDQLRIRNTNYGNADIGVGSGIMAIATDTANITFHTSSNLGTTGSAVPNNERLRIDSSGNLLVGKTSPNTSTVGFQFALSDNKIACGAALGPSALFNRNTDDGAIVQIAQDGTVEGTISVSGTTVSYNGGHLSRFSQLPSGQRDPAIKKGTVLSNLDAMCEWRDADGNILPNEQLNKVKISDVESDSNTAGVFVNWDNDDQDNPFDLNMAMTGDMIIRIAQGTSVNRGDLLISAGDGTAKPQGDDIIRSKTIAKVTSTNVTCTYEDGSYCVPCVLMAC